MGLALSWRPKFRFCPSRLRVKIACVVAYVWEGYTATRRDANEGFNALGALLAYFEEEPIEPVGYEYSFPLLYGPK